MTVELLTSSLHRNSEGIYTASEVDSTISYAADGHAECFGVEDSSFWFKHRNNCIAALVERFGCEGPFLDVGGGNGYVAKRLQDEGRDVVLLEPGETGAYNARVNRNIDSVVCATMDTAKFTPGSFGAAGLFDVIEHIENDRDFLSQVRSELVEGGMLYMTVPCHAWLWSHADIEAGHFRRHTYGSLEQLVSGMFKIEYMSYFFSPLVLPQYLLRALPHRLGLLKQKTGLLSSEVEHGDSDGIASRIVEQMLVYEVPRIAAGKQINFGASCIVAASRI